MSDIQNRFAGPSIGIGVKFADPTLRIEICVQIGQVHVVIAAGEQRLAQRFEDPWLVAAKVIGKDQVERRASFRSCS